MSQVLVVQACGPEFRPHHSRKEQSTKVCAHSASSGRQKAPGGECLVLSGSHLLIFLVLTGKLAYSECPKLQLEH